MKGLKKIRICVETEVLRESIGLCYVLNLQEYLSKIAVSIVRVNIISS